jgi:signal transduction histidine kinase
MLLKLLSKEGRERSKVEILLKRKNNDLVPVSLSFNPMQEDEVPGVCMVVTDLTEHMRKDEVLKESEARLRDLSSKLLAAQEEERKRIAHEIHDALGSLLGGLKFKAENLLGQIGKNDDLEDLIRFIQRASEEARRIQSALHPPLLDDLGILATINWFSREFQKTYSGIRIENQISIQENDIPDSVKIVIYRITQEALNNIAKHSKADLIHLCLRKIDKIELLIRDNGQGFKLDEKLSLDGSRRGIGLSSMRERAELSGGSFEIESAIGKGTTLRAAWPL